LVAEAATPHDQDEEAEPATAQEATELDEAAVVTLAAPHDAEARELVAEAAIPRDQDEEAEAESATAQEAAELDEAAEEWEAQTAEAAADEGTQEAPEIEPEEEVSSPEEDSRPYVRHGRSTARAAEKRKGFSSSRDIKGPEYLWFVTAPTDDLIAAVRAGLSKYQERFSQPAGAVLCHAVDLPALEQAELGVDVRESKGVPAHNFWIGPK